MPLACWANAISCGLNWSSTITLSFPNRTQTCLERRTHQARRSAYWQLHCSLVRRKFRRMLGTHFLFFLDLCLLLLNLLLSPLHLLLLLLDLLLGRSSLCLDVLGSLEANHGK